MKPHLKFCCFLFLGGGLLFLGCASLSLRLDIPPPPAGVRPTVLGPYRDFRGVIHCHSFLSHDSPGKFKDIIAAAGLAGLDFVVMTDHMTPASVAQGLRGWQGRTLFILGAELSKAGGSLLGVGVRRFVDKGGKRAGEVIRELKAQGALVLIAYPETFHDWSISGYEGLEVYNLKSDLLDEYKLWVLFSFLFLPPRLAFAQVLDRPAAKLAVWDRLSQSHPLVGVAGTNAHNNVRVLGRTFGSYEQLFQLLSNHVLARELTEEEILAALREGRAYMAFDFWGYVPFFVFFVTNGSRRALMGESIPWSPKLWGEVLLPQRAEIHLLKGGRGWRKEEEATSLRFPIKEAGVYRVEVYKGGKTWIISNPIYVTGPAP